MFQRKSVPKEFAEVRRSITSSEVISEVIPSEEKEQQVWY